jgi:hypothetical protein
MALDCSLVFYVNFASAKRHIKYKFTYQCKDNFWCVKKCEWQKRNWLSENRNPGALGRGRGGSRVFRWNDI